MFFSRHLRFYFLHVTSALFHGRHQGRPRRIRAQRRNWFKGRTRPTRAHGTSGTPRQRRRRRRRKRDAFCFGIHGLFGGGRSRGRRATRTTRPPGVEGRQRRHGIDGRRTSGSQGRSGRHRATRPSGLEGRTGVEGGIWAGRAVGSNGAGRGARELGEAREEGHQGRERVSRSARTRCALSTWSRRASPGGLRVATS